MKLNKKIEFGIKAIVLVRNMKSPVLVSDLAFQIGTSTHFMEQIMRSLRVAGLVISVRGPGGGYKINKDVHITAYAVAKAMGKFFDTIRVDETNITHCLYNAIVNAFENVTL